MLQGRRKDYRCFEPFSHKSVQCSALPLSAISKGDKTGVLSVAKDTRGTDAARWFF
jgi:hypothetical protein